MQKGLDESLFHPQCALDPATCLPWTLISFLQKGVDAPCSSYLSGSAGGEMELARIIERL